jgi:hypothetical protein
VAHRKEKGGINRKINLTIPKYITIIRHERTAERKTERDGRESETNKVKTDTKSSGAKRKRKGQREEDVIKKINIQSNRNLFYFAPAKCTFLNTLLIEYKRRTLCCDDSYVCFYVVIVCVKTLSRRC